MTLTLIAHLSCYCHLFLSTKLAAYFVFCLVDVGLGMISASSLAGTNPSFTSPINTLLGRNFLGYIGKIQSQMQGTRPRITSSQVPPTSGTTRFEYHVSPLRILPRPNHHWVPIYATHLGSSIPPNLVTSGSTAIKNVPDTHTLLIYYNQKLWSMSKFNPSSHH